jgi:hypothetical protein
LGGNLQSYDFLIDVRVTTDQNPSNQLTQTAEISFMPWNNNTAIPTGALTHSFTGYDAVITNGGTRPTPQITVQPVQNHKARTMLVATVDLLEILNYLISQSIISGSNYIQGIEFGLEMQQPNAYNSAPHHGILTFNSLPIVVWR